MQSPLFLPRSGQPLQQILTFQTFLQGLSSNSGSSLTQSKISFLTSKKETKAVDRIFEKSPVLKASITLGRFSLSFSLLNAHDANLNIFPENHKQLRQIEIQIIRFSF